MGTSCMVARWCYMFDSSLIEIQIQMIISAVCPCVSHAVSNTSLQQADRSCCDATEEKIVSKSYAFNPKHAIASHIDTSISHTLPRHPSIKASPHHEVDS